MSNTAEVNKGKQTPENENIMVPPVDVVEDSTGITLFADLPGVAKDKLNMQIDADTLTIEADVSLDTPADLQASRVEVNFPRYRRSFTLSKELDPEKVSAEFKAGVLKIRIPKAEHAQPRKIPITVE